jgi:hypothetical protein
MALSLIDGISAAFNFNTSVLSADLTAANVAGGSYPTSTGGNFSNGSSWTCTAAYASFNFSQDLLDRTTFCTGGWKGRFAALKDLTGRLDMFASKGSPISNPTYMFGTALGVPMLATIDSGCTITALIKESRRALGIRAAANSEDSMEFAQDGTYLAPSVTWA